MKGTIRIKLIKNEKMMSPKARGKKLVIPVSVLIIPLRENGSNHGRASTNLSRPIEREPFISMLTPFLRLRLTMGVAFSTLVNKKVSVPFEYVFTSSIKNLEDSPTPITVLKFDLATLLPSSLWAPSS